MVLIFPLLATISLNACMNESISRQWVTSAWTTRVFTQVNIDPYRLTSLCLCFMINGPQCQPRNKWIVGLPLIFLMVDQPFFEYQVFLLTSALHALEQLAPSSRIIIYHPVSWSSQFIQSSTSSTMSTLGVTSFKYQISYFSYFSTKTGWLQLLFRWECFNLPLTLIKPSAPMYGFKL